MCVLPPSRNIHDNLFTGPRPTGFANSSIASYQYNIHNNYFTGDATITTASGTQFCPVTKTLGGQYLENFLYKNCLTYNANSACTKANKVETQLTSAQCAVACGSDTAAGACGGHGNCIVNNSPRTATCECDDCYVASQDGQT